MILDQLELYNYGPYAGRHLLHLAPPDDTRPVTLIGGLNGAGKTSLMDAIGLVLYGPRAQCSKRGGTGYKEFLRRCIHAGANAGDEASIALQFSFREEGKKQVYRVLRSWKATAKSVRETVEVLIDGESLPNASERWPEMAEQFLPLGVSQFFLFDGEQIESLADLSNSSAVLRTAVQGLLGLDLIGQLSTDLSVLERRKSADGAGAVDRSKIDKAERELERLQGQRTGLIEKRANFQNVLDRLEIQARDLDVEYDRAGGGLLEKEQQIKELRGEVANGAERVAGMLREACADLIPFLFARQRLVELDVADRAEERVQTAAVLAKTLGERDKAIVSHLRTNGADPRTVELVRNFLSGDRSERTKDAKGPSVVNLGSHGRVQLRELLGGGLDMFADSLRARLSEYVELEEQLQALDRELEAVPDEETVLAIAKKRRTVQRELNVAVARIEALDDDVARVQREILNAEQALERAVREVAEAEIEEGDVSRILKHSALVRATLSQFRLSVTRHKLEQIEQLILDSYKMLLRKERFVGRVAIDAETFELHLQDDRGVEVHPKVLSAGERQLLAISILWGLARASGRPLPAIVDTPLGRLDSTHRNNVVRHYFPNASHQVVLLSTDEEIDPEHFGALERRIGNAYTLVYQQESGSTVIQQGYEFAQRKSNVS